MSNRQRTRAEAAERLAEHLRSSADLAERRSAAEHLRRAVVLWREIGDQPRLGHCLTRLGEALLQQGQFRAAGARFHEALPVLQDLADTAGHCDALLGAAEAALELGESQVANSCCLSAAALARQLQDSTRQGRIGMLEARCHLRADDSSAARRALQLAGPHLHNDTERIHSLLLRAEIEQRAADPTAAAHAYEQACEEAMAQRQLELADRALAAWFELILRHQQYHWARELAERRIDLHRHYHNPAGEAEALRRLAELEFRQGAAADAIRTLEQGLAAADASAEPNAVIRAQIALARAYRRMEQNNEADAIIERAWTDLRNHPNDELEQQVLGERSALARRRSDWDKALALLRRRQNLLRRLGDRLGEQRMLASLSDCLRHTGHFDEADRVLRRLIVLATNSGDAPDRCYAEHSLGALLLSKERHAAALPHLRAAQDGYQDLIGNQTSERERMLLAKLHHQIGTCLLVLEQADPAIDHFHQCLELHEGLDKPGSQARALVGIGNAYSALGNPNRARLVFLEAAQLCERSGDLRATAMIRRQTEGL